MRRPRLAERRCCLEATLETDWQRSTRYWDARLCRQLNTTRPTKWMLPTPSRHRTGRLHVRVRRQHRLYHVLHKMLQFNRPILRKVKPSQLSRHNYLHIVHRSPLGHPPRGFRKRELNHQITAEVGFPGVMNHR